MSFLAKATSGKQLRPQINVIMGVPKIGKTTFACAFPKSYTLDLENRSHHVETTRVTPGDGLTSLESFKAALQEILDGAHEHKTLVIDSMESLEDLIHIHLCKKEQVDSIEQCAGGFGKGYIAAAEIMRDLMKLLQEINTKRGMTVNIVAHTGTKTFNDPATNASFTRYEMRVNGKLGAVVRDLSDNILFCTYKYQTFTDKQTKKTKATGDGSRVIYTEWRPAFDAGNTLDLPFEIELDYDAFMDACEKAKPKTVAELKAELPELIKHMDEAVRPKALAQLEAATTLEQLTSLKTKVVQTIRPTAN